MQSQRPVTAVDRDGSAAAARLHRGRAEGMRRVAERMRAEGVLREDLSVAEAADVLWIITSIDAVDQPYRDRSLSPAEVGRRLLTMAAMTLYGEVRTVRPS